MLHWHRHRLWHRELDDLHLLLLVAPIATIVTTPTGPLATPIAADAALLDRVLILDCFSKCRSHEDGENNGHLRHSSECLLWPSVHADVAVTLVKPSSAIGTSVSTSQWERIIYTACGRNSEAF